MKIIDIDNWKGKKHYLWFKEYPIPFYSVTSRIDITKFLQFTKEHNYPFFITFLYILNTALNQIEEFRLRTKDGQVILFDVVHPAYTIMTKDLVFENCENNYSGDFATFLTSATKAIELAKRGIKHDVSYNDLNRLDQYYFTCTPWMDFTSVTHPMPNDDSVSVPRIAWGKYVEEDGKVTLALNINVSHALVDGYPLSQAFNTIQDYLDNASKYI